MPFGYEYDPENKKKLSINPKKAKIIKFVFGTYLKDSSISKVGKAINKKEYKTKNEKNFIYTSTRHILENIIYPRKIKYSGKSIKETKESRECLTEIKRNAN